MHHFCVAPYLVGELCIVEVHYSHAHCQFGIIQTEQNIVYCLEELYWVSFLMTALKTFSASSISPISLSHTAWPLMYVAHKGLSFVIDMFWNFARSKTCLLDGVTQKEGSWWSSIGSRRSLTTLSWLPPIWSAVFMFNVFIWASIVTYFVWCTGRERIKSDISWLALSYFKQ